MTIINVLGTAASYTAVAAIAGFGLFYFGAICTRIFQNKLHHA
ncbi:MAG: hypothetical protein Q4B03_02335 [Lachnospiraceae bacterium]|nr:hypothetical protein [Lachnospiraceae bacterium]